MQKYLVYNIYNIYNRSLKNDVQTVLRETEKKSRVGTILATYLINIFLIVFYVSIQPSCSKTRMEYFNIKTRLLIRET